MKNALSRIKGYDCLVKNLVGKDMGKFYFRIVDLYQLMLLICCHGYDTTPTFCGFLHVEARTA